MEKAETKIEYDEHKTKIVSLIITYLREHCNSQQFILWKGLKEFKTEGEIACKEELTQMHRRIAFKVLVMKELTWLERKKAQEGKKSGNCKGQVAYDGAPMHNWVTCEDKSSPTVLNESIMLTCAVDAYERRDIISMEIPNVYIQTDMPQKRRKNNNEDKGSVG